MTQERTPGLPTKTYQGKCPETGAEIETEVPCPDGWTVTQLSVYSVTFKRDSDGLVARHNVDDRRTGSDRRNKLIVGGKTVLDGKVTKSAAVEHLSKL